MDLNTSRVVQLTDWLPPEFSAVSQFALLIAEEEARSGAEVTVIGLNTDERLPERRACGAGSVQVVSIRRSPLNRQTWAKRLAWTFVTNLVLVRGSWSHLRAAHVIRFTGAPPFLIYFLAPINFVLRKRLVYRITDFYPECIAAALKGRSRFLGLAQKLTNFLRRRVTAFEVLGDDMRARLLACGVKPERITLRRDWSPVPVRSETRPAERPEQARGRKLLLYSGNWGAAHDIDTFLEGYRRHHMEGPSSILLWLNATGSGAEEIDARLRAEELPFIRQRLVPLNELAGLLVAADAHLVTLKPEFMGFVLPSKIYACIDSRRPILFVGPQGSDVHKLCLTVQGLPYMHADVGNPGAVKAALDFLGSERPPALGG